MSTRVPAHSPWASATATDVGRILVVDDNLEHLRTLEMLLEVAPHRCLYCADGPAAVAAASEQEFDLLLTDVRMSPLDGVETARAIKQLQPRIAVILMTGFDKEETPLEALRLGAVEYLDKPITDARRFLRLLDQHVALVRRAKQVHATTERLEAVVRHVDAGVLVLDAEGRIEQANRAAERWLAATSGEIVGRKLEDICLAPEIARLAPVAGTASITCTVFVAGESRLLQADATRLEAQPGKPPGLVLLIKDLTELASAQQAEGWRQMSRAITHGMKTPLGTLRLRLERLRGLADVAGLPGEIERLLSVVGDLHQRLTDLVDFARPAASVAREDLNLAVRRAIEQFEPYRLPTTEIDVRLAARPLHAAFELEAVVLAIENLLANSQEAAPDGVRIVVSTDRLESGRVAATFSDDGPGVPAAIRDDLFKRPLNSTKPGGSGIGAALVRRIVDQHQGALTWHSPTADNRGTTITLSWPETNAGSP